MLKNLIVIFICVSTIKCQNINKSVITKVPYQESERRNVDIKASKFLSLSREIKQISSNYLKEHSNHGQINNQYQRNVYLTAKNIVEQDIHHITDFLSSDSIKTAETILKKEMRFKNNKTLKLTETKGTMTEATIAASTGGAFLGLALVVGFKINSIKVNIDEPDARKFVSDDYSKHRTVVQFFSDGHKAPYIKSDAPIRVGERIRILGEDVPLKLEIKGKFEVKEAYVELSGDRKIRVYYNGAQKRYDPWILTIAQDKTKPVAQTYDKYQWKHYLVPIEANFENDIYDPKKSNLHELIDLDVNEARLKELVPGGNRFFGFPKDSLVSELKEPASASGFEWGKYHAGYKDAVNKFRQETARVRREKAAKSAPIAMLAAGGVALLIGGISAMSDVNENLHLTKEKSSQIDYLQKLGAVVMKVQQIKKEQSSVN